MAAQKKRGKNSYLNDFEKSQDGGYVYTGKTWHADPVMRRQVLVKLWVLQGCMLLAVVLPGFVTTAGLLNTFYVIIPYVFWLISDFTLAYSLGNMTFGGNPLRDYIYERSVKHYKYQTVFPLVGAVLTALALFTFLLRGGSGEGKVVCFACCIVQMAASFFAGRSKIVDIWMESNTAEMEN